MSNELSHSVLIAALDYSPKTGFFYWRISKSPILKGDIAGGPKRSTTTHGQSWYWWIGLNNKRYRAHRLAFFYMTGRWPNPDVDHKDGDGLNNAWYNLREATDSQNGHNRKFVNSNNASGYPGVRQHGNNSWRARIWVNGKAVLLGSYATPEEAYNVYLAAKEAINARR